MLKSLSLGTMGLVRSVSRLFYLAFLFALFGVVFAMASCQTDKGRCLASNCDGCCLNGQCVGVATQSPELCGLEGRECRSCETGKTCQMGQCLTESISNPPDDEDDERCGNRGQKCCASNGCWRGLFCNQGRCSNLHPDNSGTQVDAGLVIGLKAIGAACAQNSECGTQLCQTFLFPGGYCTAKCTVPDDCPTGTVCGYDPQDTNGMARVCLKSCTPGPSNGCRTGYVCEKAFTSLNGTSVCYPSCSASTDRLCVDGANCDSRGYCCGTVNQACCEGSSCKAGLACDGGYCERATVGTLATGSTCTANNQCAGGVCLRNAPTTPGCSAECWPEGYCAEPCSPGFTCSSSSGCAQLLDTFEPVGQCLKTCTPDGGQSSCRTGYVCDRNWRSNNAGGLCVPSCRTTDDCPSLTRCESGFCCGALSFACCGGVGGTCPRGGVCSSRGYCE